MTDRRAAAAPAPASDWTARRAAIYQQQGVGGGVGVGGMRVEGGEGGEGGRGTFVVKLKFRPPLQPVVPAAAPPTVPPKYAEDDAAYDRIVAQVGGGMTWLSAHSVVENPSVPTRCVLSPVESKARRPAPQRQPLGFPTIR